MEPPLDTKRQIIAGRIREARRMSGLSQGQVAKMLGLQRTSVTEMEAGNRSVSAEELARLAEIYETDVYWLLGEGTERQDTKDDRIQLAARELTKLKQEDLLRLMAVLSRLKEQEGQP